MKFVSELRNCFFSFIWLFFFQIDVSNNSIWTVRIRNMNNPPQKCPILTLNILLPQSPVHKYPLKLSGFPKIWWIQGQLSLKRRIFYLGFSELRRSQWYQNFWSKNMLLTYRWFGYFFNQIIQKCWILMLFRFTIFSPIYISVELLKGRLRY